MTRASHHHPDCPARQLPDDHCQCSWLYRPELPEEERYMLDDPTAAGTLLSEITIHRWLAPDGEDIITTDRGDCTRLEVLGLLAFASHSVWSSDQRDEDEPA